MKIANYLKISAAAICGIGAVTVAQQIHQAKTDKCYSVDWVDDGDISYLGTSIRFDEQPIEILSGEDNSTWDGSATDFNYAFYFLKLPPSFGDLPTHVMTIGTLLNSGAWDVLPIDRLRMKKDHTPVTKQPNYIEAENTLKECAKGPDRHYLMPSGFRRAIAAIFGKN